MVVLLRPLLVSHLFLFILLYIALSPSLPSFYHLFPLPYSHLPPIFATGVGGRTALFVSFVLYPFISLPFLRTPSFITFPVDIIHHQLTLCLSLLFPSLIFLLLSYSTFSSPRSCLFLFFISFFYLTTHSFIPFTSSLFHTPCLPPSITSSIPLASRVPSPPLLSPNVLASQSRSAVVKSNSINHWMR